MPYERDLRPRSQRRAECPVSMRSGNSGISERDMLRTVLMITTDGQMGMRAEEVTFLKLPTTSTSQPYMHDESLTAWIFEKSLITEEQARGYMNVLHIFVKK